MTAKVNCSIGAAVARAQQTVGFVDRAYNKGGDT